MGAWRWLDCHLFCRLVAAWNGLEDYARFAWLTTCGRVSRTTSAARFENTLFSDWVKDTPAEAALCDALRSLVSRLQEAEKERNRLADEVQKVPDEVHFWWMHDCHAFTRLPNNPKDAAAAAKALARQEGYGFLCEPILLRHGKEVRRVPHHVPARDRSEVELDAFDRRVDQWLHDVLGDSDMRRLARG